VADGVPRDVLTAEEVAASHVGQTRYTLAARGARDRGIASVDGIPLPVTLEQSLDYFGSSSGPDEPEGQA
jgi:hypothetical protein